MRERSHSWLFVAILLCLMIWLGLHWPHQSLWYDEALTTWVASGPWERLFQWCTQVDIQVPLHYIVLRAAIAVAGSSEFVLHLTSVICAVLAVAGAMALARRLLGASATVVVTVLLVGTPGFLWIAYEVRAYALALALYIWATVFLMALLDSRRPKRWVMASYCVLALAALYTHYTAIGGLAGHAVIVAWTAWSHRNCATVMLRRMILCALVIAAGIAPWVPVLLSRGASDRSYFPGRILPDQTLGVILSFKWLARDDFSWLTPDQFRNVSPLAPLVGIGLILLIAGIAMWIIQRRDLRPLIYGLAIALLPSLMVAIVVYIRPKLAGRYAWPAWIGLDLLLTCGLFATSRLIMRRPSVGFAAIGALVFVAIPWASGQTGHPPESDFRGAFAYVNDHWHAGDMVILRDGTLFPVAEYYHSPDPYIGLPESMITDVTHILQAREAIPVLIKQSSNTHGVWLLAWQGGVMDPENVTLGLLEMIGTRQLVNAAYGDVMLDYIALNQPLSAIQPPNSAAPLATTPDGLILESAGVVPESEKHDQPIVVHTWWQREGPGNGETRVSIRLIGADGKVYTQNDQPPTGWFYYPHQWADDTPILGRYELAIPANLPEPFTVKLVVYSAVGGMSPVEITVRR